MTLSEPEPVETAPAPQAAATPSLADVARRIRSRTTDLLAISIVLGASLSFGPQLISWWKAPQPNQSPPAWQLTPAGWETADQPVDLGFGDSSLTLTRQTVTGNQKQVISALVAFCQKVSSQTTTPLPPPDDAEQHLLNHVKTLTPVATEPPNREFYVMGDQFPLVVGVLNLAKTSAENREPANDNQTPRRLVCYGLALPFGEDRWTLFLVKDPRKKRDQESNSAVPPLPPGAVRTMSLCDERGELLLAFSGTGTVQKWTKFYESLSSAEHWRQTGNWSPNGSIWGGRFIRGDREWIDIRITDSQNGELTGVMQVIPSTGTGQLQQESGN
jgi:hypothetical protein